mmetsp:Transcript_38382/g.91907  ORF Transcript_38382/g.91907 Transcript_38382/m.91907 type:complete len:90 (-) Transcript_38382:1960-2229(-)
MKTNRMNGLLAQNDSAHGHYSLFAKLFALCFGSNLNPSGHLPSNISDSLIQSAQLPDSMIVSRSDLPHKCSGGRWFIFCGSTSSIPTGT